MEKLFVFFPGGMDILGKSGTSLTEPFFPGFMKLVSLMK